MNEQRKKDSTQGNARDNSSSEQPNNHGGTPGPFRPAPKYVDEFDMMFSGLSPGAKVTIWRMQPSWCDGYLEETFFDASAPIDLEYLKNQWGGEILHIKVRHTDGRLGRGGTINLRSYPPKRFGVPISRNELVEADYDRRNLPGLNKGTRERRDEYLDHQRSLAQITTAQPSPATALKETLEIISKARKEDLALAKSMLGQQSIAPALNGIDQLMEAATQIKKLKGLFGESNQIVEDKTNAGEDVNTTAMIMEVLKAFNQPKVAPQPVPQQLGSVPSLVQHNSNPSPPDASPSTPQGLMKILADMPIERGQDFFISVLNKMPEEKRIQFMTSLMPRLGGQLPIELHDEHTLDDEHTEDFDDEPDDSNEGPDDPYDEEPSNPFEDPDS